MTIEKIIDLLKNLKYHVHDETVIKLQMAIEFLEQLEQEPCEDVVSRQQALKELKESAEHHANDSREEALLRRDRDIIRALPPVTPTRENTKWVIKATGFPPEPMTVCAKCGFEKDFNIRAVGYDKIKYCPNCGRKFAENPTGSEMESEE